jgi:hypothetical protein
MALGFEYGNKGGDFLPIVKYDARAGRMFRADREDGETTQHDITRNFKAVFDFENMEVGWIHFAAGQAPNFSMVPFGTAFPPQPTPDHRRGVRVIVKLAKEVGGDCRELAGTAVSLLKGIDILQDEYTSGSAKNKGKLPIVALEDTIPIESSGKGTKSTNYQPVFKIVGWADRPKDLVASPRENAPVQAAAPQTPPSTGSKQVSAPTARKPEAVAADVDDFG